MRTNENIKEFNNGNINIKLDNGLIEDIKVGHVSVIEILSSVLDSLDCYLIGEEFCISNFDMGVLVYNVYSDKVYILSFGDIEDKLLKGQTMKLYARIPDDEDRNEINRYFND